MKIRKKQKLRSGKIDHFHNTLHKSEAAVKGKTARRETERGCVFSSTPEAGTPNGQQMLLLHDLYQ